MDRVIPLVKRIWNVWQGESLRPNLNVTRRLVCISYIENESRNTSRKFTQNALPWLDLPGFESRIKAKSKSVDHPYLFLLHS